MLTQSHVIISQMVYREAKRNGVELNKGLYLLGNIIPDFNPYHKYVKHYKDYSLDYVYRLVNGIDISNLNEASFKLGILGHYLTDYFCYPHNNNMTFKNDFKEHVIYESNLNEYLKGTYKQLDTRTYKFKNFKSLLDGAYLEYKNKKEFKEDITNSLWVNINLIMNIEKWSLSAIA